MVKTALLVIDIINSCCHEKYESKEYGIYFSKIREMVPKLIDFIINYKKRSLGPVIYTTTTPWRKEFLPKNLNNLYSDPTKVYYTDDTSGFAEEFYLVKPETDDIIITKNNYDAFTGTGLDKILKENKIDTVLVAGIFGDGCVLSTIVNGFSRSYNFVILKDLIETSDKEIRQDVLKLLKEYTFPMMYGKTLNSREF